MHLNIGILTYAKSMRGAEKKSMSIVRKQTKGKKVWDYFQSYRDENASFELTEPIKVDECKERLKELHGYSKESYERNLNQLQKAIKRNDKSMVICFSYLLSTPSSFHLFNDDGEAIETNEQLDNVLTKYNSLYEEKGKENPYRYDDIYLMRFDVHV